MQGELGARGDIVRLPGFTLNEEGEVTDVWTSDKIIVGSRNTTSVITNTIGTPPGTGDAADLRQAIAQEDDIQ